MEKSCPFLETSFQKQKNIAVTLVQHRFAGMRIGMWQPWAMNGGHDAQISIGFSFGFTWRHRTGGGP
jgi:hypothetical protein